MKIAEQQLRQIIREEIERLIEGPGYSTLVAYLINNLRPRAGAMGLDVPEGTTDGLESSIDDSSTKEEVMAYFRSNALDYIAGGLYDEWMRTRRFGRGR